MLQHHFDKIFIWIRDIELVVRGNQIDIMLVTVEKRTYARLGAIAVLVFRCLMIISAFSDPVVPFPVSCDRSVNLTYVCVTSYKMIHVRVDSQLLRKYPSDDIFRSLCFLKIERYYM